MRCKDYFRAQKCVEYLLPGSDPEQALDELRLPSCVTPTNLLTCPFLIMCAASTLLFGPCDLRHARHAGAG